jgi:hypothetical protein
MAKDLDTNLTAPQIGQPRYNTPRNPPDNNPINPNTPGNPSNPNPPEQSPGTPENPR